MHIQLIASRINAYQKFRQGLLAFAITSTITSNELLTSIYQTILDVWKDGIQYSIRFDRSCNPYRKRLLTRERDTNGLAVPDRPDFGRGTAETLRNSPVPLLYRYRLTSCLVYLESCGQYWLRRQWGITERAFI